MSRVSRVSWVRANCLIWKLNFYANWYFDTYKEGISLYVNSRYKTLPNKAKILNKKISKISKIFISKIGQTFEKNRKIFLFKKLIHQSDAVGIHTREIFALGSPWLFLVTDP